MLLANMKRAGNVSSDVILFNIDSKASTLHANDKDRILSVFEKVFNEKLGLSPVYAYLANFESYLISINKYEEFKDNILKIAGQPWEEVRKRFSLKRDEFVEAYSKTLGKSKEEGENWFDTEESKYDLSIEMFAERIKEYVEKKGNNHHVVFLIDEVGQYVGDDRQALLNLQTIVEELGRMCGGKVWVCVTSQMAIDDVVKVHSDEFSKIQGRFDTRLSLSSADTDEVIKKRILEKNDDAVTPLKVLYNDKESIIKNLFTWKKTATQKIYADADDFAETYPFVTYQFKLLQDVFNDIRTHGFAGKHIASGERSLLGAFQETAKKSADLEVGSLIPFYAFFDTVEEFLEGPITRVFKNANVLKNDGTLQQIDLDVLKVLFMLKNIKEIPTNIDNIAILCSKHIDEDKLKLKEEIKSSLERLERETLIQRNNEDYKFLTDDEQEINREIKKQIVDQHKMKEALRGLIFDYTLTDRKFSYGNNPFDLSLYLDDMKVTAKDYEIGVKVAMTQADKDDSLIISESLRDPNLVYILLEMDSQLESDLYNCLKVDEYIKNTSRITKSQQIEDIIRAKHRESEAAKTRIKDALAENLRNAEIVIGGEKIIVNSKEPSGREREALEKLVNRTYSKLDYIKTNFTTSNIRDLFHEDKSQMMTGIKVEFANQKAYDALKDYLQEKNSFSYNVTIRDVLHDFEKQPYGYREEDILYLITKLLKDEIINLVYLNEVQSATSEDTLNKILRKDYYERKTIKMREKIAANLINDAKNLALNSFDKVSMPDDEDGIVKTFIDTINDKLNELNNYAGRYITSSNYKYPGQLVIENTIELLKPIVKQKNPNEFFENISSNKDQIESNMDKVKSVIEFFKGQQIVLFDEAKHSVEIYDNNKDYADESQELVDAVKSITDILNMEEPYSEIYKLRDLRNNLNNILSDMYDKKSEPIIEQTKGVINYIDNEIASSGVDKSIGDNIKKQLNDTIRVIEASNELHIIYAKNTYVNQLKDQFDEILDRAKKALKPGTEPTPARKTVKVETLITRSYEIDSEADIDACLKDLKEKMLKELKENNNITIR